MRISDKHISWESKLKSFNFLLATTTLEGKLMAERKPVAVVKAQLPAGKATAGQQLGGALGPHGVNIGAFIKQFNEATANQVGMIIPVIINIYADRSFDIIYKTPPAAVLIKKAIGIEKGSAKTPKVSAGQIKKSQIREIAKTKMPDLNAVTVEAAMSMIAGTARSMGVTVVDDENKEVEGNESK